MAVSEDDVRHVASLARLGLEPARVAQLAGELNGILAHMDALARVDTSAVDPDTLRPAGLVLRADEEGALPLERPCETFAPAMRDGFFLVPRLATHEAGGETS